MNADRVAHRERAERGAPRPRAAQSGHGERRAREAEEGGREVNVVRGIAQRDGQRGRRGREAQCRKHVACDRGQREGQRRLVEKDKRGGED